MNSPRERISILSDEISPDFQTALELSQEWGIRNLELRSLESGRIPHTSKKDEKKLFRLAKEYPVSISALSPGVFKIPLDSPEVKKQIEETLPRTYELAHRLGTDKVIIFSFRESEEKSKPPFARVAEILSKVIEKAKKEQICLLLENEPGCWVNTGPTVLEIAKRINSRDFALNWDPGNSFASGGKPFPEEYATIKNLVRHLHLKDAQEVKGKMQWVPLGKGKLNWSGQIRALVADDYQGYYTIETHCLPKIEVSKKCLEKLRDIFSCLK